MLVNSDWEKLFQIQPIVNLAFGELHVLGCSVFLLLVKGAPQSKHNFI